MRAVGARVCLVIAAFAERVVGFVAPVQHAARPLAAVRSPPGQWAGHGGRDQPDSQRTPVGLHRYVCVCVFAFAFAFLRLRLFCKDKRLVFGDAQGTAARP